MFAKLRYFSLRYNSLYIFNKWINSYKIVSETGFKQLNYILLITCLLTRILFKTVTTTTTRDIQIFLFLHLQTALFPNLRSIYPNRETSDRTISSSTDRWFRRRHAITLKRSYVYLRDVNSRETRLRRNNNWYNDFLVQFI